MELWQLDHRERVSGTPAAAAAALGPNNNNKRLTLFEAEAKVKKSIESLKTYESGTGLRCLSTLAVYVANAQNKDDPKYVLRNAVK